MTSLVLDRALSPSEFLEECITFKREHAPKSRFFAELLQGKLSRQQIKLWAKEFYWYVEPTIPSIAAWLSHAPILPDREQYRLIARNLAGEMGFIREPEHHEMYLQFCAALDISRDDLLEHLPLASTVGAASAVGYYCRSSFEEGLGAFGLAVELNVPGRPNGAQILYEGMKRNSGLGKEALEFWEIHIEAEEEHGSNAERALLHCGQTIQQQARIRRAFRFSALAHAGMSEGYDRFL